MLHGLGAAALSALTTGKAGDGSILGFGPDGIRSTAYEVALNRQGVLGDDDHLRLSVSQPLHVSDGALTIETMGVTNRETGELGNVSQTIGLGGNGPRYVSEVLYGRPILDGAGDMSAFTQYQSRWAHPESDGPELAGGIRLTIEY